MEHASVYVRRYAFTTNYHITHKIDTPSSIDISVHRRILPFRPMYLPLVFVRRISLQCYENKSLTFEYEIN